MILRRSMNAERRALCGMLALSVVGLAVGAPGRADATLVRGLTLPELLAASARVAIVTPLFAESHWETIGGQRCIVTDTRVRVEDSIRAASSASELLVRSLGGRIGAVGELVHGQPILELGQACVAFLKATAGDIHWTAGMAQGHYPLLHRTDGATRLTASRSLPHIKRWDGSAVQALRDRELADAKRLIGSVR
jgi:hypothetical protein